MPFSTSGNSQETAGKKYSVTMNSLTEKAMHSQYLLLVQNSKDQLTDF